MTLQQITFESLTGALEAPGAGRGTPVTPPDHYLNLKGEIVWDETRVEAEESDGLLTKTRRSTRVREWSALTAAGPADVNLMPWLFNLAVKGGVTAGTHPTISGHTGVLTYDWTFQETLTADDLATATLYFGDPNIQIWQAPFSYLQSLELTGDGSGTGLTTVALKGMGAKLGKVATPTFPSLVTGPLIVPNQLSAWVDVGSGIGTTSVLGQLVSAKHTIPIASTPLFLPTGPGGAQTITALLPGKREITTVLTFVVPDTTQIDHWEAQDVVKVRVEHNGPLIETITGTPFYQMIRVDTYGKFQKPAWGAVETNGRTVTLTLTSEYQASLGGGWTALVRNKNVGL